MTSAPVDPPDGGVRSHLRAEPFLDTTGMQRKERSAVFTKGNTRYLVVALAAFASLLASLGGGWFDGS